MSTFAVDPRDLNMGPYSWAAGGLLTKPSPDHCQMQISQGSPLKREYLTEMMALPNQSEHCDVRYHREMFRFEYEISPIW